MTDLRTGEQALAVGCGDGPTVRRRLARHMSGHGVELGPGHCPFYLPFPGTTRTFVDRWEPEENRALFPELGDSAPFPKPDVVANFDTDRLAPLGDESQDFVVASHVLEHLAEPLGFLAEIHRVLVPGGLALILLPDRRYTFDRVRPPTSLAHLIEEHDGEVTEVDDDHVREFLLATSPDDVPEDDAGWPEAIQLQRRRSIHVHCWSEDEFPEVLDHCIRRLGQRWELVDAIDVVDGSSDGIEFGYVLRRSSARVALDALADRFHEVLADIRLGSALMRSGALAEPDSPERIARRDALLARSRAAVPSGPLSSDAHDATPLATRLSVRSVLKRLRSTR